MNTKAYILLYLNLVAITCFSVPTMELLMPKKNALKGQHCIPCEGGVAPLSMPDIKEHLADFHGWRLSETKPYKIERTFTFKDFVQAMQFVNAVADAAESEGHHPDITIVYNKVTMQLFTHAIQGLSLNDFIMADVIDDVFTAQQQ